jgi:23S rRNA pseudouridine2605 synthase
MATERIAKYLAHAGVASRREIERMIEAGRIAVDGTTLTSPATLVSGSEVITVDGTVVGAKPAARLWRFYKPVGVVTTARDPQGRPTVFEQIPAKLGRVISVGRLDLNSEGLLLLTNNGELARHLELPATGLVRQYRVRVRGIVTPDKLERLKKGMTVEGVRYGSILAEMEKNTQESSNVWLQVQLTEGKNREIRKVMTALELQVNRLIRFAYGPYELGDLKPGEVKEVPARDLPT